MLAKDIIGVDLDNTIAKTDTVIREIIHDYLSIGSGREDIFDWSYGKSLNFSIEQEKEVFEKFHQNQINKLSVIEGAYEGLDWLTKFFTVWIITQRPLSTYFPTRSWLRNKKIKYDTLIFSKRKEKYFPKLRFLIEDNLATAIKFSETEKKVFLIDAPWNREENRNLIRVRDWGEIIDGIRAFVKVC
jgi:5'(3')-deoxyribonucleotidase